MADLLVVDDDVDMADMLTETLQSEGYSVRTAYDGLTALQMSAWSVPDAVLLDVEMPVFSGLQVARELARRRPAHQMPCIVLLSGVPGLAGVASCVGTPYYLAKPCGFDGLVRLIRRVVSDRRRALPVRLVPWRSG